MKYNPAKHHRRSIRLKGYDYTAAGAYFITICTHHRECVFGEIVNGVMQLNPFGQLVHAYWQRLPHHFANLQLDAFVVMPNHLHGILHLTNPRRGAAFGDNSSDIRENYAPNATPHPTPSIAQPSSNGIDSLEMGVVFGQDGVDDRTKDLGSSGMGVAFGRDRVDDRRDGLPNAAPLQPGLVGESDDSWVVPRLVEGSVGAIVLNFKSVTTRRMNRIGRSQGIPVWQRNYYEHIIRDEKSLQFIQQYIDNNPLSWQQDQLHPDNPSRW
jgi:putative transposase